MASRRCSLPLAILVLSAPVAAESRRIAFNVLLDDRPIGTHTFEVNRRDDGSEDIQSLASFDVKALGIRLYRYRHQASERWRDGCVERIEATTNDNGAKLAVRGTREHAQFRIERPRPIALATACVSSFAYWNPQLLLRQTRLLNPQTGQWVAVRFTSRGEEPLVRSGATVMAQRHRLEGEDLEIDLWYSAGGEWLQLASKARGDRQLVYRRAD